jgi:adenylate kinase
MNIILLAPPAAGKGTQSAKIIDKYHLKHISTGDLLRASLDHNDELSNQIREVIKSGALVNDEIILKLIEKEFSSDSNGYVLDGFPRNLSQAMKFEELLQSLNQSIDKVLYFEVPEETLQKRIVGRRTCKKCGRIYNMMIEEEKSKIEETCDVCNIPLTHREDDNEEAFKFRYQTYLNETEPLIHFYQEKGLLSTIDATSPVEDVFKKVEEELDPLQ